MTRRKVKKLSSGIHTSVALSPYGDLSISNLIGEECRQSHAPRCSLYGGIVNIVLGGEID